MTSPRRISEVLVQDVNDGKRLIKQGDTVDLLLPSQRLELLTPEEKENDEDYFVQRHYEFLRNWLGEGPFEISWIGLWPCGRAMLYLKNPNGEPGCHASDFKYVKK